MDLEAQYSRMRFDQKGDKKIDGLDEPDSKDCIYEAKILTKYQEQILTKLQRIEISL